MRIVELSDHPSAMLREERKRQHATEEQAKSTYAAELALHQERMREAWARQREARRRHRWLTWLRAVFAMRRERARAPRPRVIPDWPSGQEEILMAGRAGEQRVASDLGRVLDDAWVLFRGYRNRGGEIDHLLVGPRGIFAMEGKHRNATVHVDGDHWRYDKYDRYGNLVAQGEIADRGGRSPSVQVNQPADELEKFLRSRGQNVTVRRVVVLTHDRSRLGTCRNPTVFVTNSTDQVLAMVRESPAQLASGKATEIERLIRQDHVFHEARAHAAGRKPPRR